ncbi:unnamed protein product [Closterium sp. Naga37s-1]|nr:unnamed protein product [Closterium sp. Naga37s-1]
MVPPTVAHASSHRHPRFPPPSPTLPPTVAQASPHRRPSFPPPSPTLPPTVAHASPHRRPRFPPPSPTLPPTVTHASPHRRPRFPPPSPTLPPTVAHRHRRPPPLSPTLALPSPSVRLPADLPSLPPLSTSLSPTLGGEVWRAGLGAGEGFVTRSLWGVEGCVVSSTHPSPSCTDLLSSLAPTPHAWQVVVRLWSRVFGAQPGQRVQAGSKECSAAGGGRPPLPLPSSLPPSLCLTTLFTLSVARPPFLPSSISLPPYPLYPLCCPSSLPPILLSCHSSSPHPPSIQSPFPFPSPTLPLPSSRQPCSSVPPFYLPPCTQPHFFLSSAHHLIRPSSHPPIISSAHHLIRPSSHPPILSSAHHLIRPSSHRRPRFCLSAFPCSLSPTHASSRSPFRPSSVFPLLIFCLRAFFVPHPPSEFVVRVCAGLPCIQL